MRFTKMQGIGNDYIYVDCFSQQVDAPADVARRISDRHFGVGGDGLILIMPSDTADVRMQMFNSDGSEAQMCGNGIRCLSKYTFDHGLSESNPLSVETAAGIRQVDLTIGDDGKVSAARVDMGEPILQPQQIPVNLPGERIVDHPIETSQGEFRMTCVSMGNPHVVIFVDEVALIPLEKLGREIEAHELFPQLTNVHFVQVNSTAEVTMRTWERGSGITLACGTGASAVCVAGVLSGYSGRDITVHLPGGDLQLNWSEQNNRVAMTGPAEEVFSGEWEL